MKKAGYQIEMPIETGSLSIWYIHTTHDDSINRERRDRQKQTKKQTHVNTA